MLSLICVLFQAWDLWIEGHAFQLVDNMMEDVFPASKVIKCIQVGLLCVQDQCEDRPTMSFVVSALDSESPMLPQPKQPGFYIGSRPNDTKLPSARKQCATNEMTVTLVNGR